MSISNIRYHRLSVLQVDTGSHVEKSVLISTEVKGREKKADDIAIHWKSEKGDDVKFNYWKYCPVLHSSLKIRVTKCSTDSCCNI